MLADRYGNVYSFGERDCSIQRNHQKIIEETPSVSISQDLKQCLYKDAIRIAKEVDYIGAGTIEFLISEGKYYFIEMNTRIQVEHPITEMVFNIDLLKNQILSHSGEKITLSNGFENYTFILMILQLLFMKSIGQSHQLLLWGMKTKGFQMS